MKRWKYHRPKVSGRAAFKTFLKRRKFKLSRDFYGRGCCIAQKSNRLYRFRFHAGVVDVSCLLDEFDRWANSTESTISVQQFIVHTTKENT